MRPTPPRSPPGTTRCRPTGSCRATPSSCWPRPTCWPTCASCTAPSASGASGCWPAPAAVVCWRRRPATGRSSSRPFQAPPKRPIPSSPCWPRPASRPSPSSMCASLTASWQRWPVRWIWTPAPPSSPASPTSPCQRPSPPPTWLTTAPARPPLATRAGCCRCWFRRSVPDQCRTTRPAPPRPSTASPAAGLSNAAMEAGRGRCPAGSCPPPGSGAPSSPASRQPPPPRMERSGAIRPACCAPTSPSGRSTSLRMPMRPSPE